MRGHVRDPAGNPVPHARLSLGDAEREPQAETDSAGEFSLTFAPLHFARPTRAQVRVQAAGYHTRVVRLPVRDSVEVMLFPDSLPAPPREWSAPELAPLSGVHYSIPLRYATSIGVARGRFAGFHDFAGWYLAAEVGAGGVKARLGFARWGSRVGIMAGPALLRTTSHARGAAPHQSWGGAETRVLAWPLSFTLGGYTHLRGDAPGEKRLLSLGLGMGF